MTFQGILGSIFRKVIIPVAIANRYSGYHLGKVWKNIMDKLNEIELFDCPICHGAGLLEEENGWCIYASCLDCGCHTAEFPFNNEEERLEAARRAASMWNVGKVLVSGVGD